MTDNGNMNGDIATLDAQLNQAIIDGKGLEAFELYYAEDVVMQENENPPTVGKAANRVREQQFKDSVTAIRNFDLLASGVGDNVTFGQWFYDFDHAKWGSRKFRQVSVRTWRDGKIINETFYYGSVVLG